MQSIDDILNFIKADGLNILELSRNTGISMHKLYKWRDNKGRPKYDDAQILADYIAKVQNFGQVAEPGMQYPNRNAEAQHTNSPINNRERELERALVEELRDKVKILQQHNEFLARNFEVSLQSIHQIGLAQLVHLKALEWYQADQAAKGDPKKTNAELQRVGNKIAELTGAGVKEGTPVRS